MSSGRQVVSGTQGNGSEKSSKVGVPESYLGLESDSGWKNGIIFQNVLKHVVKHRSTTMDNHKSYRSVGALEYGQRCSYYYASASH